MGKARGRRIFAVASAGAPAATMLAAPASATPKNDWNDSHKVTICHVTNSATNSYVIIEVDVAAFDGVGKSDHKHHMSKDGLRSDVDVPKGTTDIAACLDDDPPPPQPNT